MRKFIRVIRDLHGLFIFLGLALGFGGSYGHVLAVMVFGIVLLVIGMFGLQSHMYRE